MLGQHDDLGVPASAHSRHSPDRVQRRAAVDRQVGDQHIGCEPLDRGNDSAGAVDIVDDAVALVLGEQRLDATLQNGLIACDQNADVTLPGPCRTERSIKDRLAFG